VLGFDFTNESIEYNLRPGFGLNLTKSFTPKSSIEIGAYYRSYIQSFSFAVENQTFKTKILEKHLSVPITYKLYTKFINISAGPSFEFFLDLKQRGISDATVEQYELSPAYNIGFLFKAGKDFKVGDKLIVEPEFRLSPIPGLYRLYAGLGLNLKTVL
jgi:hypothetical protein